MKNIKELSDAELRDRLETLRGLDLSGADTLCDEIEKELAAREAEKVKDAEAKEEEKELRRKQHEVLGKFYQIYGTTYKVIGVVYSRVFLVGVTTFTTGTYSRTIKNYAVRDIDELLQNGKEIAENEYKARTVDVTDTADDLFKKALESFDTYTKGFNKYFERWF